MDAVAARKGKARQGKAWQGKAWQQRHHDGHAAGWELGDGDGDGDVGWRWAMSGSWVPTNWISGAADMPRRVD